jgi:hypothetical protein
MHEFMILLNRFAHSHSEIAVWEQAVQKIA